jgi:hypothetical protein
MKRKSRLRLTIKSHGNAAQAKISKKRRLLSEAVDNMDASKTVPKPNAEDKMKRKGSLTNSTMQMNANSSTCV